MSIIKNDRFLRALRRESTDVTPVWMMRQAGRYLPEYREVRAKAGDFMSLCKNADLACEVTMQPLRRFELDAAILFSDILTIPDALGLGLYFEEGEGPKFRHTMRELADIQQLPTLTSDVDLAYVMQAVRVIKSALGNTIPLIGFSGSPWTLATYMIEGGSSRDFIHTKRMIYQTPEVLHALLSHLSDAVVDYLAQQVHAGVDVLQIFDSWGGVLAYRDFELFSLQYMRDIIRKLRARLNRHIPIIVFTKGGGQWLDRLMDSGADALGLDGTTSLRVARKQCQNRVALQGNLDPTVLLGSPTHIIEQVDMMLDDAYVDGHNTGYIANLGHGITQFTNPDHAKLFIDRIHARQIVSP